MKKLLIILITIGVVLMIFTSCSLEENDGSPYPKGGKDTVAEFGDRRFVILRGKETLSSPVEWVLYDRRATIGTLDMDVDNYSEIAPYVYATGSKGYTKLNYETGALKQAKDLSEFSDEEQDIFKRLEITKDKVVKK